MTLASWACPSIVDASGKVTKRGCGGNWGLVLPDRCPNCRGPLTLTQRVAVTPLTGMLP
jgi:hypothetical protein